VAWIPYSGVHLCARHFVQRFESRALWAVEKLGMIRRGERVAVAVSGGKDSLALLRLLSKHRDRLSIELVAVLIDEGIRGYRPRKVEAAERYAREWGVELVVRSFRDLLGLTLDEAVARLMEGGLRYKPCTVCGVFRRYALNAVALELGADKLATAHNLDDEVQAFLLNMAQASFAAIAREGAATPRSHPKLVPRVKPFYFIPEKEVLVYALLQGIETPEVECPYIVYSTRHVFRRWLNAVAEMDPTVKHRVMALKVMVSGRVEAPREPLRSCTLCGMPASKGVCKACELRGYLSSVAKA